MSTEKDMSFEEALAAYSEPAKDSTPPEQPETPPVQNLPPTSSPGEPQGVTTSSQGQAWQGNPAYFQTGKKAGQLRPKPRISVEYKENPNESELTGDLIGGAMFLTMIDLFIPGAIVVLNNWLVSDKKDLIKMEEMQLSKDTMKRLEPIADASLKRIKLRGDPTIWLFVTMLGCYGVQWAKIKFERKLEEALKAKEERK